VLTSASVEEPVLTSASAEEPVLTSASAAEPELTSASVAAQAHGSAEVPERASVEEPVPTNGSVAVEARHHDPDSREQDSQAPEEPGYCHGSVAAGAAVDTDKAAAVGTGQAEDPADTDKVAADYNHPLLPAETDADAGTDADMDRAAVADSPAHSRRTDCRQGLNPPARCRWSLRGNSTDFHSRRFPKRS
jgi:hypothetical protein